MLTLNPSVSILPSGTNPPSSSGISDDVLIGGGGDGPVLGITESERIVDGIGGG